MNEGQVKKYAVIVAGGKGSRMGSQEPKQFIEIGGLPVLMHTIKQFYLADASTDLIVVLPQQQIARWAQLVEQHSFGIPHRVTSGGATRFQSVKKGLRLAHGHALVAIHDGVRPFTGTQTINAAFAMAAAKGSAVVAISLKDSIREITKAGSVAKVRSNYRLVQTPQVFNLKLLKEACETEEKPFFTDDASVYEYAGHMVYLVDGHPENIKITTPEDLLIAETLLKK